VRVNDRGPFAEDRIIDVSKAAAMELDMIRSGIARVRVEYLEKESERFAELLGQGRDPTDIDVASEVLNVPAKEQILVAEAPTQPAAKESSLWDYLNPISSAQAASPPSYNRSDEMVQLNDLAPPSGQTTAPVTPPPSTNVTPSSFDEGGVVEDLPPSVSNMPPPATPPAGGSQFIQLGTFTNQANAKRLEARFSEVATTHISQKTIGDRVMYRVRLGPFINRTSAEEALARSKKMGIVDARIVTE
jgi:rare lipoprotein A